MSSNCIPEGQAGVLDTGLPVDRPDEDRSTTGWNPYRKGNRPCLRHNNGALDPMNEILGMLNTVGQTQRSGELASEHSA